MCVCVCVARGRARRFAAKNARQHDHRPTLPPHRPSTQSSLLGPSRRIVDRESDYHRRRLDRALSPGRADPFAAGGGAPAPGRSYADTVAEAALARERDNTLANIRAKQRREEAEAAAGGGAAVAASTPLAPPPPKRAGDATMLPPTPQESAQRVGE